MAKQNILKDDWKGKGGPWKRVCPWMNKVARMLNNISGHGSVEVETLEGRIEITGYGGVGGMNRSGFICGISSVRDRIALLNEGSLDDHGKIFTWNGVEVSVPGAVSFVTVRYERGVGATYMDPCPTERLENDGIYTYFPLYRFEYGILKRIYRLGEIIA
jgi:hypothetical protein